MNIEYKVNASISPAQFLELLQSSTLGERRPIANTECITGMIKNSSLVISAWAGNKLIGIARSVTDFHYACYLADLAVDEAYQRKGIGKKLQALTQAQLGEECRLILIAAPAANEYYAHIGFENNERCWVLDRQKKIKD